MIEMGKLSVFFPFFNLDERWKFILIFPFFYAILLKTFKMKSTKCKPWRNLTEMLHVLGEQIGMKLSCIKQMSKVRGLSIEPRSSTSCID